MRIHKPHALELPPSVRPDVGPSYADVSPLFRLTSLQRAPRSVVQRLRTGDDYDSANTRTFDSHVSLTCA
jgi:hypothetical protein